jgi:hypothetical protein
VATLAGVCVNCLTSYEAVAINSVVVATAGSSLWQRLTSRTPRELQRQQVWESDADFVRSLGLDPADVLGPPPLRDPAPDHERVEPEPEPQDA